MKLFSRLIALAALGCSAVATAPTDADARTVDCRRVPAHMRVQAGCPRMYPMAQLRPQYRRPLVVPGRPMFGRPHNTRPVVIGAGVGAAVGAGIGVAVGAHGGLSPAKSAQLKALLAEKAQVMFGEGPKGKSYSGYHEVPGTSVDNPCKPGYQPIATQDDDETGRTFVRCAR